MRILVVEDYEPLSNSVRRGLQEAGFAVDATAERAGRMMPKNSATSRGLVLSSASRDAGRTERPVRRSVHP